MNIAALVDNLSISQSSFYMIKNFNKLAEDAQHDACCFYANLAVPPTNTMFATMHLYYSQNFHGALISDNIEMANVSLATYNNSDKYLYLWDIEWLRGPMSYEGTLNVLRNPFLKIIARSESHAKLIENFCNKKPCGIVEDWNIEQLKGLIESQ